MRLSIGLDHTHTLRARERWTCREARTQTTNESKIANRGGGGERGTLTPPRLTSNVRHGQKVSSGPHTCVLHNNSSEYFDDIGTSIPRSHPTHTQAHTQTDTLWPCLIYVICDLIVIVRSFAILQCFYVCRARHKPWNSPDSLSARQPRWNERMRLVYPIS